MMLVLRQMIRNNKQPSRSWNLCGLNKHYPTCDHPCLNRNS